MSRPLKVIHANLGKSGIAQYSLLNDEDLSDFSIIFISEPSCFRRPGGETVAAPVTYSYWKQLLPSTPRHGRYPVRLMLWIRKDIQARQIAIPSADITATVVTLRDRIILVAAVYVAKKESVDDSELTSALEYLRAAITQVGSQTNGALELLICGDFNRHDQLWGGDQVCSSPRNGEGAPIIDFMEDFHLQSVLPRGTVTYESAGQRSTIDLILASPRLTEEISGCGPASTAYGHDHLAIEAHFETDVPH